MTAERPARDLLAKHARAAQLRGEIAADLRRLRRDAVRMMPGMSPAGSTGLRAFSRPVPAWAVAAAAGVVAGVVAALRRRRAQAFHLESGV